VTSPAQAPPVGNPMIGWRPLSVIICSHNPRTDFLAATLAALRQQTLPLDRWELIIVDNASEPAIAGTVDLSWHPTARVVVEPKLGLTPARLAGIASSGGDNVVFADDDNVLAPTFLANAIALLATHSEVGIAGGRVVPLFQAEPPPWTREFFGNLALGDHGATARVSESWKNRPRDYPSFAPVGAGLVARRAALAPYVKLVNSDPLRRAFDRRGRALTSGGDNDLVMTALESGWRAAYWPQLCLEHIIPPSRLTRAYLARLNYAIARSWIGVRRLHHACPWPSIRSWTVPLRQARAFFRHRAWLGSAHYVRWRYACGHFAGLAD